MSSREVRSLHEWSIDHRCYDYSESERADIQRKLLFALMAKLGYEADVIIDIYRDDDRDFEVVVKKQ
jgi:hypothetical protein